MRSAALLSILLFLLCCVSMLLPGMSCQAAKLEILAAGDTTPGMRMLAQRPDALFSPEALARITAADAFLWNCETSGPFTGGQGQALSLSGRCGPAGKDGPDQRHCRHRQ